jgi:hypothetical protein
VIDIYVGPEKKRYVVHNHLLKSRSEYFDKALNGPFNEAKENSIYLEKDGPATVGLLVAFMYRGGDSRI